MSHIKRKPKKDSMIDLINKYSHDHLACVQYFFNIKWPTGFYCDKCGCTHYYFNEKRTLFEWADCGHQHLSLIHIFIFYTSYGLLAYFFK